MCTAMRIGIMPPDEAERLGYEVARSTTNLHDGMKASTDRINAAKIPCIPSICYQKKILPLDMGRYEALLRDFFTKVKVELAGCVIENEPNFDEINGTVARYVEMIKVFKTVQKNFGSTANVYTGGYTFPAFATWAYEIALQHGDKASADIIKSTGLHRAYPSSVKWIKDFHNIMIAEGLDVKHNFHVRIDEKTLKVLPIALKMFNKVYPTFEDREGGHRLNNGNVLMCGECSFAEARPEWVTQALNIMMDHNVSTLLLYSELSTGIRAVRMTPAMEDAVKPFLVD